MKKRLLILGILLLNLMLIQASILKIPLCNSTNMTSCVNVVNSSVYEGTPMVVFFKDGYLFLTNDTYYANTNITINQTNINYTNITYYVLNASNVTINVNDSYLESWLNKRNWVIWNNNSYSRIELDNLFFKKADINLSFNVTYPTREELYNLTKLNITQLQEHLANEQSFWSDNFSIGWRIIIIVIGVLVILILFSVIMNRN